MFIKAARVWNRYKYRFVPWVAQNINENSPRVIVPHMLEEGTLSKKEITNSLLSLCSKLTVGDKIRPFTTAGQDFLNNMQACHDHLGFTIETQPSNLEDGGTGVFVSTGRVKKGSLVAIYPGTVYQPWEPVFFISVANSFLFRCADGVHIDGSKDRLSKSIFTSCARRDRHFGEYSCDLSWLDDQPLNPLSIGQFVNNKTPECPANVAYQEYEVPRDFPWAFKRFLPNIEARTGTDQSLEAYDRDRGLKMVVLVSLRDIEVDEELYSSYYTLVYNEESDQTEVLENLKAQEEQWEEEVVEQIQADPGQELEKRRQEKQDRAGKTKKMRT